MTSSSVSSVEWLRLLGQSYSCKGTVEGNVWQLGSLRATKFRIGLLSAYLEKSGEACLRNTRGAGGAAISLSMKLHGVVFGDSPAFLLFPEIPLKLKLGFHSDDTTTVENLVRPMKEIANKLETLFYEAKASPTDVDCYGNTLFHVCHRLHILFPSKFTEIVAVCCTYDFLYNDVLPNTRQSTIRRCLFRFFFKPDKARCAYQ